MRIQTIRIVIFKFELNEKVKKREINNKRPQPDNSEDNYSFR